AAQGGVGGRIQAGRSPFGPAVKFEEAGAAADAAFARPAEPSRRGDVEVPVEVFGGLDRRAGGHARGDDKGGVVVDVGPEQINARAAHEAAAAVIGLLVVVHQLHDGGIDRCEAKALFQGSGI